MRVTGTRGPWRWDGAVGGTAKVPSLSPVATTTGSPGTGTCKTCLEHWALAPRPRATASLGSRVRPVLGPWGRQPNCPGASSSPGAREGPARRCGVWTRQAESLGEDTGHPARRGPSHTRGPHQPHQPLAPAPESTGRRERSILVTEQGQAQGSGQAQDGSKEGPGGRPHPRVPCPRPFASHSSVWASFSYSLTQQIFGSTCYVAGTVPGTGEARRPETISKKPNSYQLG